MLIHIDLDVCEGHGTCMQAAPELFVVGEDDQSHLVHDSPADDLWPRAVAAARSCPTGAITVER